MKRIWIAMMLGSVLNLGAISQSISPLEQAMTSTSLISRPSVFRDMQANIDTELGNIKPGLQVAGLHDAIGNVRGKIIGLVTAPVITYDISTSSVDVGFYEWSASIQMPKGFSEAELWNQLKNRIQTGTKGALDDALDKVGKPSVTSALVDAITASVTSSDLATGVNSDQYSTKTGTDKLSWVIAEIVVFKAQNEVDRVFKADLSTDGGRTALCMQIQGELNSIASNFRSRLVDVLNDAENELSNVIDEMSKKLVALNTGIGITQGKGSFNGGAYLSLVTQQSLQLGIYINGQLNKEDSTQPTESLAGFHVRLASDATQCDFLGAGLFGARSYSAFSVAEIGIGITTRVDPGFTVGVAGYAVGSQLNRMQFSVGLNIQPTAIGSASFYIGFGGLSVNNLHPLIQTSVPILPSL